MPRDLAGSKFISAGVAAAVRREAGHKRGRGLEAAGSGMQGIEGGVDLAAGQRLL